MLADFLHGEKYLGSKWPETSQRVTCDSVISETCAESPKPCSSGPRFPDVCQAFEFSNNTTSFPTCYSHGKGYCLLLTGCSLSLLDIYCSSQKHLSLHCQAMPQDCPQGREGTDTAWHWRVNRHVKDASPGEEWQDRGWARGWQFT